MANDEEMIAWIMKQVLEETPWVYGGTTEVQRLSEQSGLFLVQKVPPGTRVPHFGREYTVTATAYIIFPTREGRAWLVAHKLRNAR